MEPPVTSLPRVVLASPLLVMTVCQFRLWSNGENCLAKTYRNTIGISLCAYAISPIAVEMDRHMRMANPRARQSRPREIEQHLAQGDGHRGAPLAGEAARAADARDRLAGRGVAHAVPAQPKRVPGPMKTLSVRAQNVLKELAAELTGEQPPKGAWAPTRELLLALTAERLAIARNCGPRTTREIICWAQGCGVTIRPLLPAVGSLSEMWARVIASGSAGTLTSSEAIEALQKSIRRKSVRIPTAFQTILVELLRGSLH